MRKITLFLAGLLLSGLNLQSQTIQHTTFNVDSLFQLLDTSHIATGILIDKVPTGINLDLYDGTCNDCVMEPGLFEQMMLNFKQASFQENNFLDSIDERYQDHLSNNRAVPIQIANIVYNKFKEYALDNNLIDTTSGLPQEGANTTESPYYTKRFVGLAVPVQLRPQGLSFTVNSSFYLSNDGTAPSEIQIDLGDGLGYRSVAFGQTLTPQYGEISNPEVEIGVKLTINEQIYTGTAKMTLSLCGSGNVPPPVSPPWSIPSQFQFGNLVADETYNPNGHASGNVYVYYRSNPDPGTENQFRKPLIVVEGIDFEPYNQQNAANYQMGAFGWCALWGQDSDNYPQLAKMPQLLNDYHAEGYDIIMLDFKDGATDIKENAYLLQTLIKRVNQNKTADAEANVVIGASMGAIVARYALADMEADGTDHCTRLYLSFDGPHQGANIPLGAQYAVKFFATNSVEQFAQARKFLYGSLSRKAARQLLSLQLYNSWESEHNAFFNELNNLGYPQKCQNIAIASGNGNGSNQGYSGGAKIVEYDYTASSLLGLEADLHIWALPGRSSDNQIFYGQIPYFDPNFNPVIAAMFGWVAGFGGTSWGYEQLRVYASSSLAHYDNAPGGIRQVAKEMEKIDTDGRGHIDALEANQCFVPTISALDINTMDLFFDVDYAKQQGTLQTPFDEVYYPPTLNTFHVEATDGTPVSRGDNIAFAKTSVNLGQGVSNPVLTSIYNYGEELHNTVTHTQVINSGKLYLYGDFGDSKTGQTPAPGNTHVYKLGSNCVSSDLVIDQDGELIIGDAAAGNKAEFRITDGASLTLKDNGKLTIKDGSQLIIEDGGNLVFEDGAQIELSGYGSRLAIKGKLSVGDNANFTFIGNGRLVFDQSIPWTQNASTGNWYQELDDYWEIGQNSTFTVDGPSTINKDHVLIEAFQPVSLKMEDGTTFDQVSIKYGQVVLHDEAFFFAFSPVNLQYVKFNTAYSWQRHGGFRIVNNPGPNTIYKCSFENGDIGALAHWAGGGPAIHFNQCDFSDNLIGLQVTGGSFKVSVNSFFNNRQGIVGEDLTGNNYIKGTTVTRQNFSGKEGIKLTSQTGAYVGVENCDVEHYRNGISLEKATGRVECSQIRWCDFGLAADEAFLDIGDQAGNIFLGNAIVDVLLEGPVPQTGINLVDGYNDFAATSIGGNDYINAFLNPGSLPISISGDNNKMPTYIKNGNPFMPVYIQDVINNTMIPFTINPNLGSIPSFVCDGATQNPGLESAYVRYVGGLQPAGIVAGGSYNGEPFRTSALDAIEGVSFGEKILRDDSALVKIIDLLSSPIEEENANTGLVQMVLYNQMHQALGNAYQYGYLKNVQNEGGSINDTVIDVVDVIQAKLDAINSTDSNAYIDIYRYNLDKAFAYRVSGHYDAAMQVFDNSHAWATTYEQSQKAGYWECVCAVEKAYFDGELSAEDYRHQLMDCRSLYAGYTTKSSLQTMPFAKPGTSSWKPEYRLSTYPIPTSSNISIHIDPGFQGDMSFTVTDLSGKILDDGIWKWSGASYDYDVSRFPKGTYLIKVKFGDVEKIIKLLKD